MEPAVGGWCTGSSVGFRLRDHDRRPSAGRLKSGGLPGGGFPSRRGSPTWELRLPRPDVWRIEYALELHRSDGGTETACDPDNRRRAPGGFGAPSVRGGAESRGPAWLPLPPAPGEWREVSLPLPAVRGEMVARIWSPAVPAD